MAWRYHGCYVPDPYRAKAHGQCDRCNRQWELNQLNYQYDFRGDILANTKFRVCPECMDIPYQGYRPVKLPPDPRPVYDPRVEPFLSEESVGAPFPGLAYASPIPTPPPTPSPTVSYLTEDGSQSYVAEDGVTIYVPE